MYRIYCSVGLFLILSVSHDRYASPNGTRSFPDQHAAFREGRCALYISFPSAGTGSVACVPLNASLPCTGTNAGRTYIWGKMGCSRLPGSTQVLNRATNQLVSCTVARLFPLPLAL